MDLHVAVVFLSFYFWIKIIKYNKKKSIYLHILKAVVYYTEPVHMLPTIF